MMLKHKEAKTLNATNSAASPNISGAKIPQSLLKIVFDFIVLHTSVNVNKVGKYVHNQQLHNLYHALKMA